MPPLIRDRYELLETLGAGGEGRVVKAVDRQHGRVVALKIRTVRDGRAREELLGEARTLLAVPPHPALPLVREDFFEGDSYVVAMDWVDGTDLASLIRDRGRPGLAPSSVLAYLAQAAEALTHLHSVEPPVIHGDVKPGNLILTKGGRVKLVDFGMSSAPNAIRRRTGTPGFRAPELAADGTASRASDVYALAATAFALLTGSAPSGVLPSWEGIDTAQATQLEAALRLGLATDPSRRPATPGEFVERLRTGWGAALPSGVMTFCLSDIEGSTSMWETDPAAMAAALVRHDELIADHVESHGGRFLKSMGEGDSTVSVFDSAPRALEAALVATRALADEQWPAGLRLLVRFGLHTGEADRRGSDYFGPTLNLAARLRGQADGGQIFVSSVTADLVTAYLPAEYDLVDLGPHRLRGLGAPERIHAVRGPGLSTPLPVGECPYRGLLAFEPADRGFFFGREQVVENIIGRLTSGGFLAVVGASGSGKSSVLRAGVVAAVLAGDVDGLDRTRILTPGVEAELDVVDNAGQLVVIDQFEELFTVCDDPARREAFIERLLALSSPVLIGVRADLYGKLSAHADLAQTVAENQVLLTAMTDAELERAVREPARLAGLRLESGLVELIVRDVTGEPGALPLLSHALRVTWERRDGRTLTVEGYRESGGVSSAIAQTADAVVDSLPQERHGLVRNLFLRLTELGEGLEDTRRRVPIDELTPEGTPPNAVQALLERLADARLVTLGEGTAEVAHEVLIREWPTLRAWLDEDRAGVRLHQQLGNAARLWEAGGRETADLYRGTRLGVAVEWARSHQEAVNVIERAFLDASVAESNRERRDQLRSNRRLRALLGVAGALLVLSILAGVVALVQRSAARHQALVADAQRLGAQALIDDRLDHSLLLARAGVALDNSATTRSNLLAALLRHPAAIGVLHGDSLLHNPRPASLAVSPDGRTLAIGDGTGTITFFDTATRRRLPPTYKIDEETASTCRANQAGDVRFSPDGSKLSMGLGECVDVVDVRSHRRLARVTVGHYPGTQLTSPAVSALLTAGGRDLVVAYLANPQPGIKRPPAFLQPVDWRHAELLGPPVRVGRRSPAPLLLAGADRRTLYLSGADENATYAIDARTLHVRRRYPFGGFTNAVSGDGRMLALAGQDGAVRVADLATGRVRKLTGRHDATVRYAVFSPDGRTLVTTGDDGRVIVWDVRRGEIRETLTGHSGQVDTAAISPDGDTLYTGGLDGSVIVWDLAGDRRLDRPFIASTGLQGSRPPLALSADGRRGAVLQADGSESVFDTRSLRREIRFKAVRLDPTYGFASATSFSPDGRTLATLGHGGAVTLWDTRTWRSAGAPLRGLHQDALALDFSPDGRLIAAGDLDGTVKIWDLAQHAQVDGFKVPRAAGSLAFSPDSKRVAVAVGDLGTEIRDIHGRHIAKLPTDAAVGSVAFSPDGRLVASGQSNGATQLWATQTRKPIGTPLQARQGDVFTVSFSPDSRTLATSSNDGILRLWDVATQKPLGTPLPGEDNHWVSAAFTPDGSRLFTYYDTGNAFRWEVSPDAWKRHACSTAGRNLTHSEWNDALPNHPYQAVCDFG